MDVFFEFTDEELEELRALLDGVPKNPYDDYDAFHDSVRDLIDSGEVPERFAAACAAILAERRSGGSLAHLIRNCPRDEELPLFDQDDSVEDKYKKKLTFIGEAFLELFSQLTDTPLLAYTTRNNGDFFHDVYADSRYTGTQTQKSDGELFIHNDRTAHPVRADFLALLGMRCPEENEVYTAFYDGRDIHALLSEEARETLREKAFVTPYDEYSQASNSGQVVSEPHAVLENEKSFRYYETRTRPHDETSARHYRALMEFRNAVAKVKKLRHKILEGDLFVIANQDGLHSREHIEIRDAEASRRRWLLKTYAFRDPAAAAAHEPRWSNETRGRVQD